jgi:hypothetical protein
MPRPSRATAVARVQTGVRLEERLVKVLKALAEMKNMTLGDLLEGICLHAFEGKAPFSAATRQQIRDLKRIYSLDLTLRDSHRLEEGVRRRATLPGRPSSSQRRT